MLKRVLQFRGKAAWLAALPFVMIIITLSGLLLSAITGGRASAKAFDFADPAFLGQWQLADKPIQDGAVTNRSWVWGPAFSDGKTEDYAEAPGGKRQVQYFDKARMEINNPNASRNDKYFVTNGLLVTELISGQLQTGDNSFAANPAGPSKIPVAGDPDGNGVALLYSSFAPVASLSGNNRATDQTAQAVINTLSKDGVAAQNSGTGAYNVSNAYYESTLGHNIPTPFWNFLNQQGQIYSNGAFRRGQVLEWQVAAGLPLTEAYWSRAVVAGEEKDVLVQMFQRRVLTYTPSNTEAYRVEMGNVGQHYYRWRYENQSQPGPQPTPTSAPLPPTATPLPPAPAPATPAAVTWSGARQVQVVGRPVVRVRPTDGDVWIVGENTATHGIYASDAATNFSNVINLSPNGRGERVSADFDASGNLHVLWQARSAEIEDQFQTYYRKINANGQPEPYRNLSKELINNGVSGLPAITFSPITNRLYMVHEERPFAVVFYESTDQGASWINRQVLATGNSTPTGVKVGVDNQGNVHVVWLRLNGYGDGNSDIFGADRIGGNWGQFYNITNYKAQWSVPGVAITNAPNGDMYLAWISPAPSATGVGVARYDLATKSWQPRQDNISKIQSPAFGRIRSVSVAVTSNGTVWVAFCAYDPDSGHGGSYYVASSNQGASWTETRTIIDKTEANTGFISSFGSKVYFTAVFLRETWFAYREQ